MSPKTNKRTPAGRVKSVTKSRTRTRDGDNRPRSGTAPGALPTTIRDPARILDRMDWNALVPLLGPADGESRTVAQLKTFAAELLRWNEHVSNLVSRADEPRLVDRHIRESLAGLEWLRRLDPRTLIDLGSGGGFPAIPLAIADPGRQWTLVESRRNKTLFLRKALQVLQIEGVQVITGRLEMLLDDPDGDPMLCDAFTSRATMKLGPTLALAARVLRRGGHAILWKGSGLAEEVATGGAALQEAWNSVATTKIADGPNVIAIFALK